MYGIFDIEVDKLSLDHVRAFLTHASEEGVNWEAKADEPDAQRGGRPPGRLRPEHVQRSVCGFANQVGGYLIVGARREGGAWNLPGVKAPSDEPEQWLDQVIRGLRPVPRYRQKAWELDDGRVAAVVEVEPLTQTPCMTRDGQVFERVSGNTERVTDPARLAELLERGRRARAEAEARAERAALQLLDHRDIVEDRSAQVVVAMAAASYEPDIGGRLFHERFNRRLREQAGKRLVENSLLGQPTQAGGAIRQSYVEFGAGFPNLYWVARANWDGAAAVSAGLAGEVVQHFSLFDFIVWPAWKLAADLVRNLGGYGDSRVQLSIRAVQPEHDGMTLGELSERRNLGIGSAPPKDSIYAKLPETTHIRRWSEVREATSEEIGSMQREFQRAAGLWTFEGVPDPPA